MDKVHEEEVHVQPAEEVVNDIPGDKWKYWPESGDFQQLNLDTQVGFALEGRSRFLSFDDHCVALGC